MKVLGYTLFLNDHGFKYIHKDNNEAKLAAALKKVGMDTLERPVKAIMDALANKDMRTKAADYARTLNASVLT